MTSNPEHVFNDGYRKKRTLEDETLGSRLHPISSSPLIGTPKLPIEVYRCAPFWDPNTT